MVENLLKVLHVLEGLKLAQRLRILNVYSLNQQRSENCARSQGAYREGNCSVIVRCTMFLISCIFSSKCLYFTYYMAGYLLDRFLCVHITIIAFIFYNMHAHNFKLYNLQLKVFTPSLKTSSLYYLKVKFFIETIFFLAVTSLGIGDILTLNYSLFTLKVLQDTFRAFVTAAQTSISYTPHGQKVVHTHCPQELF